MQTTLKNEHLTATINHNGAELTSLIKNGENFIWDIDETYWNKTSPVLFPIVGALKNNDYQLNGQHFNLPRHGFARNQTFDLQQHNATEALFSIKQSPETLAVYPFDFEFQIHYTLISNVLEIKYVVINNSENPMPFSVGAHPAFKIKDKFENYSLVFDKEIPLTTYKLKQDLFSGETEEILLKNNILALKNELFEQDALVFKNNATDSLTMLYKGNPILQLRFSDFPYLGIWSKANAPFVCLEPWCGLADNASHEGNILEKEGINILASGQQFTAAFDVEIF
jgi:galactose mutarotase-like enzyme